MAERYSFLLTPRWIGLILITLLACAVCVALGVWQFGRYQDRAATADQINQMWETSTTSLDDVAADHVIWPEDVWQPVEVSGEYVPGAQTTLRNRPVDGSAASQILTPLLTEIDGEQVTVVVNRGWLPAATADAGEIPAPPQGDVTIFGRVRSAEAPINRDPASGTAYTITPDDIIDNAITGIDQGASLALEGLPIIDGFIQAESETPQGEEGLFAFPDPDTSLGPHLSYALQWGMFAVAALFFVPLLARREADENDDDLLAGTPYARKVNETSTASRIFGSGRTADAEEEDSWLDDAEAPTSAAGSRAEDDEDIRHQIFGPRSR